MSLLDDVFEILERATHNEKSGNRIEAATKYFEAVYLMRKVMADTPQESTDIRRLLETKIKFYSAAANRLYFDDSSTIAAPAGTNGNVGLQSPMTQLSQQTFFQEEVSQIPAHPPTCESPRFTQSKDVNKIAGKANAMLARAIELDESGTTERALEAYMKAAELYLEAIRECDKKETASSLSEILKRRLEGALDRIEQLKLPQRRQVTSKVTKSRPRSGQSVSLSPSSSSSLTKAEIEVLKRSSLIASGVFMPWCDNDANNLSRREQEITQKKRRDSHVFQDKAGDMDLSPKQQRRFHRWARPLDIIQMRKSMGVSQRPPVMIRDINPYSIQQQYVTDCSFIASLCVCAAYEKKFRKRLITSIIYPQDKNGVPMYNPEGKYIIKIWLNGVARQVIVDDRLPIDPHSNLLCSSTKGNKDQLELWVPIIEKAFMKLSGGYDFPGSNSGVDLFSLTGWIPERIFFPRNFADIRDFETEPERAWDRLYSANSFGDCLITVSTTREISESEADKMGLVTGHAYAVLEVFQTQDGARLVLMKNPWASKSWTGKFSSLDKVSWQNKTLRAELGYNPEVAATKDDGIFWISWDDVLRYFQNIQLSWNPALFSHKTSIHDFWPGDRGPANDTFNIGENPQYVLVLSDAAISKKASIWVQLSRHVTKQEQDGAEVDDFLTIHLLRNTEQREIMWYPHGKNTLVNGAYSNNPHVLVRYDITRPDDKYISLVLSQHKKSHDLGYTLSCYCTEPFELNSPQNALPYGLNITGSWSPANAGGPLGEANFFRNPMYQLCVPAEGFIQLRCSAAKSTAVNVIMLPLPPKSSGKDLRRLATSAPAPVLDSGNYRHGFAVTERVKVTAGVYAIIVSTYHSTAHGAYSVKIAHSCTGNITVEQIP